MLIIHSLFRSSLTKLGKSLRESSRHPRFPDIVPKQVSYGWEHTAVVMSNGDFYIWGSSKYGAIGSVNTSNAWAPVKFKFRFGNTSSKNSKKSSVKMKYVS